ncbi:clathrin light chain, partial [Aureobasidium melanogenum]|uniref:Clathrin light chain n=1 Tax=Aureobasidium melanogenum (strain CBS 110374) TaxID=1043003 RepID=A0A074W4S9_AURM1
MADKFPSVEDLDSGLIGDTTDNNIDTGMADEPSDFLARERALLGDDADQFATPADNAATAGDDDLLGGGESHQAPADHEMGGFESSFPAIDTSNEGVAPGGTITGSTLPYQPKQASYEDESEPDVIREWRERRDMALQHRDEVSQTKKEETIKAAHSAIDDFYENYNNKKDKTVAQTRKEAEEFLKSREDTTAGGTSWDRVSKLVDLSGKGVSGGAQGSAKAKFRELLLNLRKDENAPGASGY